MGPRTPLALIMTRQLPWWDLVTWRNLRRVILQPGIDSITCASFYMHEWIMFSFPNFFLYIILKFNTRVNYIGYHFKIVLL